MSLDRKAMSSRLTQIRKSHDSALRKHAAESLILAVRTGDGWYVSHAFAALHGVRRTAFVKAAMQACKVYAGLNGNANNSNGGNGAP